MPQEKEEKSSTISRIIHKLNSMPWAIRPEKLQAIQEIIDRKLKGETIEFEAATRSGNNEPTYMTIDKNGLASIQIHGTVGRRLNMFEKASGGVSTEILLADFKKATSDKSVKGILLHIDSPGGMVDGIKELTDAIYYARDQKPVFAYAEGEIASAAYWLGSAAHKVFSEKTALIGSIGVVATHYDFSVADEKQGVKRTYIYNGKYKRIANDAEPLSEEGHAYLQEIVDDFYGIFVEDVERNRENLSQKTILDMESKIYIADKALKQGLIDGIGDYSQIYTTLKMEARIMTKDELQAQFPDLFKEIQAEGLANASREEIEKEHADIVATIAQEATDREHTRIMGIFTEAYGKETGEKFSTIIKPGATVADMMAFAQDRAKQDILKDLVDAGPDSVGQELEVSDDPLAGLEGEALYKAEYERTPDLKDEYGSIESYIAYRTAEAAGRVKSLKKK